ncbi:MAG TPA: hypothetical protein VHD14_15245 [Pseudolabrys sp.]|jgi:hypothetical protein|nr:hypothetical protein [Pseudolabrys sp.]
MYVANIAIQVTTPQKAVNPKQTAPEPANDRDADASPPPRPQAPPPPGTGKFVDKTV